MDIKRSTIDKRTFAKTLKKMVKRTNRIQNLNRMISEYKREQDKFELIQNEIFNQQREIEDLRLLILSTNFLNTSNSSNASSCFTSANQTSNASSLNSINTTSKFN